MAAPGSYPLPRERNLILGLLILLAAVAWAILVWQATTMDATRLGLTMGMGAAVFLAIWIVMMVAMMFPTAAPMILMFNRVAAGKRARGQTFVPTWVFVGAYLLIWTLFGVLAYGLALGATALAERAMGLMEQAARIGGVVLILAGLYQLSPLKQLCLSKCRTPLSFLLSSWREGYGGAVRMGLEHGLYCLGCCWLLFVILFPLGIMNVAAMALITLLIFAEKTLPSGPQVGRVAAGILIAYGALVVVMPHLLPTMLPMMPMDGMG
jgi:predicted metal-binding membrane protein